MKTRTTTSRNKNRTITKMTTAAHKVRILRNCARTGIRHAAPPYNSQNKIKQATESADAERRVETQIKAKGYDDCFAYISENGISVTVKGGQIDGSKVAAMKDIIVTETHIPVKNIKINAM